MSPLRHIAGALVGLLAMGGTVQAESLVTTVSNANIAITSNFDGEMLSLFGNVEPGEGQAAATGPYEIIIQVIGPSVNRVVRLKTSQAGLWMNTRQVEFNPFPTYYQVLSSGPLTAITDHETLEAERILPDAQTRMAADSNSPDAQEFGVELVRLMTKSGMFGAHEQGVKFLSSTAYVAQLALPVDISTGLFITQTYLFRDGKLLAKRGDSFAVNKSGFERYLFTSAHDFPLAYGIICVLLAVGTGWLGGVVFRR